MRAQVLSEEPLCMACRAQDRVSAATEVDHIVPIAEGGTDERENLQGLCSGCHAANTAREAQRGKARG